MACTGWVRIGVRELERRVFTHTVTRSMKKMNTCRDCDNDVIRQNSQYPILDLAKTLLLVEESK